MLFLMGCKEKFDQEFNESFWVGQMAQSFNTAQAMAQTNFWLTNRLQIASIMPVDYLAGYEGKFLKYGRKAGFTNSLLEKYLLLPQGIMGPPPDHSEIMLVSAVPMQKKNGRYGRMNVSKYKERFGGGWIDETKFQESLRNSGIQFGQLSAHRALPSMRYLNDPDGKKAAMQKMLSQEGEKAMEDYEREHPILLTQHRYFPHACMGVLTISVTLIIWWFIRGGSKSSH